jgi:hypothetical protein
MFNVMMRQQLLMDHMYFKQQQMMPSEGNCPPVQFCKAEQPMFARLF